MFKAKRIAALAVAGTMALSLAACGGSSSSAPAGGNAEGGAGTEKTFNLKLGHNMAEDHAVHISMTAFADAVKEKSNGTINITIFPNGTLGSETDMISQIQNGALDMAKVSASTLGNFSKLYNAYSVPYVFEDVYKRQYELSTIVGGARVTVSKLINELCDEGFIRILNRNIQISVKEYYKFIKWMEEHRY